MKAKPLLSDIQTTKIKFNPGDRVLVRVSSYLTQEQQKRLKKSIIKFVGEDVRILIVNCLESRLLRKRKNGLVERLADESYVKNQDKNLGVANIKLSVIDFNPGDQLMFMCQKVSGLQKEQIKDWLKQWVGNDVEIIIMKEDFH